MEANEELRLELDYGMTIEEGRKFLKELEEERAASDREWELRKAGYWEVEEEEEDRLIDW